MNILDRIVVASQRDKAVEVTLTGAALDLILGLLKIIVGFFSNSFGLVSDGIHSLSDLLTDALVLFVSLYSKDKADAEHPYGHARFETIATIVIGTIIFSVAGIIIYDSIRRVNQINPDLPGPGWLALSVALLSIASKEWIYRYTKKVALKMNSSMLMANAWHSRTDAFSSIAVLIGIFAAMLGYPTGDILAAFFVALMIGKIAWELVTSSVKELVDTALPQPELESILSHIEQMEGIVDAHSLRSRLHGGHVLLDVHVQVDSMISVSEGHFIADQISASIMANFAKVTDIVVHIDPEFDLEEEANTQASSSASAKKHLPFRQEATAILLQCCQTQLNTDKVRKINLHYLENQIQAEIFIDNSILDKELVDNLNLKSREIPWLKELQIYGCF